MKANPSETWEKIVTAGERVAQAYQQMVGATDDLAHMLEFDAEYVLRRVLPRTPAERRNSRRIVDWLTDKREEYEAYVLARQADREEENRRVALLAKLNLTLEERCLLGIDRR